MAVTVDESKCTGCGICSDACPVEAITIDQVAKINAATCTECGSCVAECPNAAISIEEMTTVPSARDSHAPPRSRFAAMRDTALPNHPPDSTVQYGRKQISNDGLLRQIIGFFGKPAGQRHGQGRRRGKRRGGRRGRGNRRW